MESKSNNNNNELSKSSNKPPSVEVEKKVTNESGQIPPQSPKLPTTSDSPTLGTMKLKSEENNKTLGGKKNSFLQNAAKGLKRMTLSAKNRKSSRDSQSDDEAGAVLSPFLMGVSLKYLKSIKVMQNWTVSDVAKNIFTKLALQKNCSYAEYLLKEGARSSSKAPLVKARADAYLIYDPNCKWLDLIDALTRPGLSVANFEMQFDVEIPALLESDDVYVYLDVCSIPPAMPVDFAKKKWIMREVGTVHMVMIKWSNIDLFKHASCVFECCSAIEEESEIKVAIYFKEMQDLRRALLRGINTIYFQSFLNGANGWKDSTKMDSNFEFKQWAREFGEEKVTACLVQITQVWLVKAMNRVLVSVEEGDDSAEYANLLSSVGSMYQTFGDLQNAKKFLTHSHELRKNELLDSDAKVFVNSLSSLAGVLGLLKEYDEACILYELAVRRLELESDSSNLLATMHERLGKTCLTMLMDEKAKLHLDIALEMKKKLFGARHPAVASALEDLLVFGELSGQFQPVIESCKEIIDIRKSTIGKFSPLVSKVYVRLADNYFAMGDFAKSGKNLEEALEILKVLQNGNQESKAEDYRADIADVLSRFGEVHKGLGDMVKAGGFHEQALSLRLELDANKSSRDLATCYSNLAFVHYKLNDMSEAIELYEKALGIYISYHGKGEDHADIATTLNNLAKVCLKTDRDRAKGLAKESLDMRIRMLGEKSPTVVKLKADWEKEWI